MRFYRLYVQRKQFSLNVVRYSVIPLIRPGIRVAPMKSSLFRIPIKNFLLLKIASQTFSGYVVYKFVESLTNMFK